MWTPGRSNSWESPACILKALLRGLRPAEATREAFPAPTGPTHAGKFSRVWECTRACVDLGKLWECQVLPNPFMGKRCDRLAGLPGTCRNPGNGRGPARCSKTDGAVRKSAESNAESRLAQGRGRGRCREAMAALRRCLGVRRRPFFKLFVAIRFPSEATPR